MAKSLCLIPARGGSKRIPRKNVLPLNGVPLLSYTIRAAKDSGAFDHIVVSSEDEEILALAKSEGVETDQRPAELAADNATKVQVVREYLNRPGMRSEYRYITALLPTCPFRTSKHLREAFDMLRNGNCPYLIGVTEYDFPIQLALSPLEDSRMKMTFEDGYNVTRSQDIAKRYHPNGAMYMATVEAFLEKGTFFNEEMLAYRMSAIRSFDIDYPYQFAIAEILAKNIDSYE